jgi:hypothetical protein
MEFAFNASERMTSFRLMTPEEAVLPRDSIDDHRSAVEHGAGQRVTPKRN